MKVVLTLGNTPAECGLEIDGKKIPNAVEVKASVDIEEGPKCTYVTTIAGHETVHEVDFKPVVEDLVQVHTLDTLFKE